MLVLPPPARHVFRTWVMRRARGPGPQRPHTGEPTEAEGPAKPLVWGQAGQGAARSQHPSQPGALGRAHRLCSATKPRSQPPSGTLHVERAKAANARRFTVSEQ